MRQSTIKGTRVPARIKLLELKMSNAVVKEIATIRAVSFETLPTMEEGVLLIQGYA